MKPISNAPGTKGQFGKGRSAHLNRLEYLACMESGKIKKRQYKTTIAGILPALILHLHLEFPI